MTSPLFVVNPTSGAGRGLRVWQELRAKQPGLAAASGAIVETDPERARVALEKALEGAADPVVAVGGDGTAHLVINRLLDRPPGRRPCFGLIPAGTGSDLARALALPSDPGKALAAALGERRRSIDAIEVLPDEGKRRFVANVLSLGLSGVVVEALNRLEKKTSASYVTGALAAIRTYRPVPCRISVDGELFYDQELLLLAVANGRAFGKGMKIAPAAELDDGLLDVVAIRPAPLWKLLSQFPRMFLGTHLGSSIVTWRRAREVHFEALGELPRFDLDGEDLPPTSFTARILPAALQVAG